MQCWLYRENKAVQGAEHVLHCMQGGKVWEKAGVGVSVVYGTMPPEAYRAAKGNNNNSKPTTNGVRPAFPSSLSYNVPATCTPCVGASQDSLALTPAKTCSVLVETGY